MTSASEHYDDPNMTRIEVTHRRRSPKGSKKNKTGDKMASGFARPSSTHLLPKAKAKHYPVGKRVTMTMQPMADPDEAQDSNDGDEQDLDG